MAFYDNALESLGVPAGGSKARNDDAERHHIIGLIGPPPSRLKGCPDGGRRGKVRPARAGSSTSHIVFHLAEVAVLRAVFAAILRRIDRWQGPPRAA